uniref:Uncharacterized protein n=1 Tax=Arundo donax TaxID=35708 RepID=A0A0A9C4L4_ARUDO
MRPQAGSCQIITPGFNDVPHTRCFVRIGSPSRKNDGCVLFCSAVTINTAYVPT